MGKGRRGEGRVEGSSRKDEAADANGLFHEVLFRGCITVTIAKALVGWPSAQDQCSLLQAMLAPAPP